MARRKEGPKTWKYSMEFKARAVEMSLQEGIQVQQVADGLGIHPFMLSRWRKEYREGRIVRDRRRRMDVMGAKKNKAAVEENGAMRRLEQENARLKKENELLKKWQRYLAARHRSDSDSSPNTQPSSASDTCVGGSASRAADTTPGGSVE